MQNILWIGLGGAAGSIARYLLDGAVSRLAGGAAFPFGTLVVNIVGSFLMGAVMQFGLGAALVSPTLRIALTTGLLGGFTTYSTFNYETLELFREGAMGWAFANIGATVVLCLAAGFAGTMSVKSIWG